MAKPREGDYWENIINSLTGPFPEVGDDPPTEESMSLTPVIPKVTKKFNGIDPDAVGKLAKITMNIYFFFDNETNKQFLMQDQRMSDLGEMTLAEAAEIVQKNKRRR